MIWITSSSHSSTRWVRPGYLHRLELVALQRSGIRTTVGYLQLMLRKKSLRQADTQRLEYMSRRRYLALAMTVRRHEQARRATELDDSKRQEENGSTSANSGRNVGLPESVMNTSSQFIGR